MKTLLTTCLILLIAIHFSFGQKITQQSKPFELGQVLKINSSILKEERTLNIYLPEGYTAGSAKTYPVIYLLDGSANEDFIHIVGIVQFLTMIESMPKSIVVGIANVDRKRDFTFPTQIKQDLKDFPSTGHSTAFISFIEKELQPFIAQQYSVTASKTIIGQSFGALLATEILLKNPDLFSQYMIISPSLWWNNESLLAEAPKLLTTPHKPIQVYLSVGKEGKTMENDAKKLAELLQAMPQENLKTSFLPLPAEDHLTILHNSIYKGFQLLYPKVKTK